jgi:hypothetical protein
MSAGKATHTSGLEEMAKLAGGLGTPFGYMEVGTGTTTPTATQGMATPVKRRACGTITTDGVTVHFECAFQPGDFADGTDLYEIGVFNASFGGAMLGREVLATPIKVWSAIGCTVACEFPVSAATS